MAAKSQETPCTIRLTLKGCSLRTTAVTIEPFRWIQSIQGINDRLRHHRSRSSASPPEPREKDRPTERATKLISFRGAATETGARGGGSLAGRRLLRSTGATRRDQLIPPSRSKPSPLPAISSTTTTVRLPLPRLLLLLRSPSLPKRMATVGQRGDWASSTGPCLRAGRSSRGRHDFVLGLSKTRRSSGGQPLSRQR